MSDIFEQVAQIVTDSPAHQALAKCDEVQRYIRHGQIDGQWGDPLDQGYLIFVSQYTLPNDTLAFMAALACGNTVVHMILAEKEDGAYIKTAPDAIWGNMQTVGGGEA